MADECQRDAATGGPELVCSDVHLLVTRWH